MRAQIDWDTDFIWDWFCQAVDHKESRYIQGSKSKICCGPFFRMVNVTSLDVLWKLMHIGIVWNFFIRQSLRDAHSIEINRKRHA